MMSAPKNLTGQEFGKLIALQPTTKRINKKIVWLCKCECGNLVRVMSTNLTKGNTHSCGCSRSESLRRHGHKRRGKASDEYKIWVSMKQRCENANNTSYMDYGGRGIRICDEWNESFEQFYKDMGPRPSKKHSIERIDVNGNYDPSNCKWATSVEQIRNQRTRSNSKTGYKGVNLVKRRDKYHARIGINGKNISLGYFDSIEDAANARKDGELKYWGVSHE